MHRVLEDIIERKRQDVAGLDIVSLQSPASYKSTFYDTLANQSEMAIIAEIKLASPTHEMLGSSDEILERARIYEEAGADAISFITERYYFKSDTRYVPALKAAIQVPLLQKDFVIDEYQIHQARALGSDAILLIARLVDSATLRRFVTLAQDLGIEPVVEVDNNQDLARALDTSTRCIAVNARDLGTLNVDIDVACRLLRHIPQQYLKLGFSGIETAADVQKYRASAADVVLVGTSLMQAVDIKGKIRELRS